MAKGPAAKNPEVHTSDDVFTAIGNETRIEILKTLGEAGKPLSFSELRRRVGMRHSGQFDYHLKQLKGHFVDDSPEGYKLTMPGERIIEGIYSGVLTNEQIEERAHAEFECWQCGAPVKVILQSGFIDAYCTECVGMYPKPEDPGKQGALVRAHIPPAGLIGRSPAEALSVALVNTRLDMLSYANGICPRCCAMVEHELDVCEDHDTTDEICDTCDRLYAVMQTTRCVNCIAAWHTSIANLVAGHTAVLTFFFKHGWSLVDPSQASEPSWGYEEEVQSTDPLEVRCFFLIKGTELVVDVDESLNVNIVEEN